jgi:nucleoside-diphosphate-sugar epimerase
VSSPRIILPGGAGLVGQNLILRLKERGYTDLVVLDKHVENLEILRTLHQDVTAVVADLAEPNGWAQWLEGANAVVMLQAQIGSPKLEPFIRNTIVSTRNVLEAIKRFEIPYTVHIGSSVVNSVARDYYTDTKREQEQMVLASGVECVILRPTLMFGWFDRKHLGWLSRFMHRVPVFPIPGTGHFMRQPLYVGDFCNVIISCIESRIKGATFDITGLERIDYVDIIREVQRVTRARCSIVGVPYGLFYVLLKIYSLFDNDPPFTAQQLKALVAGDEFDVIDWQGIFQVRATPFAKAIDETFNDPNYSKIVLRF